MSTTIMNGTDFLINSPQAYNFVSIGGFNTINYTNSPLPVAINLTTDQGYGPGYDLKNTFEGGIARFVLTPENDIFYTKAPTSVVQVSFLGTIAQQNTGQWAVVLQDGSIILVWQCADSRGSEICAAKYDKNDNRILPQRIINTKAFGNQITPAVVLLNDDSILVAWNAGPLLNVDATMLNADLSVNISEFTVIPSRTNGVLNVGLSSLTDGRIAFVCNTGSPYPNTILGKILNITTQTGTEFTIYNGGSLRVLNTVSSALPNGGFITVWTGNVLGNSFFNIIMQEVDNNGTLVGSALALTTDTNGIQVPPFNGDQMYAQVAVDNQSIFVVWQCTIQVEAFIQTCAMAYDLNLIPAQSFIPLNIVPLNYRTFPSVASLSVGGFIIAWQNSTNVIETVQLYGNLSKIGTDSPVTNTAANYPYVSSLNAYGSLISWQQNYNTYYRKYNTRVEVYAEDGDDSLSASGMGDYLDCGPGNDTISWVRVTAPCVVNLQQNRGCGNDQVVNCENVICPDAGCTVTTNGGAIFGGSGSNAINTVIVGKLPVAVYVGTSTSNILSFAPLNTSITFDMITGQGSDGVNNIIAPNVNSLIGSSMDSNVTAATGATISGGNGNDIFSILSQFPSSINGGAGFNTLFLQNATQSITLNFNAGSANSGTASDGTNTASLSGMQAFVLSPNGDTFTGGNGNFIVYPGAGNDVINGGISSTATLVVSYAYATSSVICNLNTGSCNGGSGRDTLTNVNKIIGSDYGDDLRGNPGNSNLNGAAGDDILRADGGLDSLTGGIGKDIFFIENNPGTVTITDFNYADGDRIDLTSFTNVHSKDILTITDIPGGDCAITSTLMPNRQITLKDTIANTLIDADFIFAPATKASASSGVGTAGTVTIALGVTGLMFTIGITYHRYVTSKTQRAAATIQKAVGEAQLAEYSKTDAVKVSGAIDSDDGELA